MANPLRIVIVDDEPLGRTVIREMLRDEPACEIIGECATGREAIELIRQQSPDLLFLDVQMPVLDGFTVLQALAPQPIPLTIFVTAYDHYAVRAFEVHAVDYLLKPFDRERFRRAFQRAQATLQQAQTTAVNERILALLEARQPEPSYLERLVIKAHGRVLFLRTEEIDWLAAEGNYVCLHVKKDAYWLRETISNLETQLNPKQFARIHRSHIVNLDRIKELHPWSHGEYRVLLEDGTELTLSRSYRERFHSLL
ncbi:MAG: LytTR family DNA-binding domain-containing protein [Blastocatellia bacterium]